MLDLIYLANDRLPTEKARGCQMAKMCEAFAQQGLDVWLVGPRRRQPRELRGRDVFDFYGLEETFRFSSVYPGWDSWPLSRFIPRPSVPYWVGAWNLLWGRAIVNHIHLKKTWMHYTRDLATAYWLAKKNLPFVVELHMISKRMDPWFMNAISKSQALKLVVAVTSHLACRAQSLGIAANRLLVEPDAVDWRRFNDVPAPAECRRMLGLPSARTIVGYLGSLRPMGMDKGIGELIRAFASLPGAVRKRCYFLCVGDSAKTVREFVRLARQCGLREDEFLLHPRVAVADVPLWVRSFDIGVIPWPRSEYSSFFTSPLKMFEYMASGVPVLASDLPSLRDVLRHGGNAWLVEPGKAESLSQGLGKLIEDRQLRSMLARNAAGDVQDYVWSKRAARILARLAVDSKQT